jgi:hypothetical protein
LRTSQRKDFGELAAGLTAWIRGDDSEVSEAASEIVAEALLVYLKQNTKD